jgi:hypothetical protein
MLVSAKMDEEMEWKGNSQAGVETEEMWESFLSERAFLGRFPSVMSTYLGGFRIRI